MKRQKAVGTGQKAVKTTTRLLPSAFCLLPSAYCLLPTAYCLLLFAFACNSSARQSGMPPQAQERINTIIDDINAGRYEKIYREAADEWKQTITLEQSNAIFNRLKTRLGEAKGRTYQTAREEQTTGGHLPGHSLVVRYYTTFERGEGTETFTLLERDGHWLLAKYFVNSDALKQ